MVSLAAIGYPMPVADLLLCQCNAIYEREVLVCIRRGARTVDEVGDECDAGTGCGSCRGAIKTMIEEEQQRKGEHSLPPELLALPLFARNKSPKK